MKRKPAKDENLKPVEENLVEPSLKKYCVCYRLAKHYILFRCYLDLEIYIVWIKPSLSHQLRVVTISISPYVRFPV